MGKVSDKYWRARGIADERATRWWLSAAVSAALALSVASPRVRDKIVLSGSELLGSLSAPTIATIVTSAITLIGFWVAFAVSHSTWRGQMKAQLQTAAGVALAKTVGSIDQNLRRLKEYADVFQQLCTELNFRDGVLTPDSRDDLIWLIDEHEAASKARLELKQAWRNLLDEINQHEVALESTVIGFEVFHRLVEGYWEAWRSSRFELLPEGVALQEAVAYIRAHNLKELQSFSRHASHLSEVAWAMVADLRSQSSAYLIGEPSSALRRARRELDKTVTELLDR